MNDKYATNFYEILTALANNDEIKSIVIELIKKKHIVGKITEEQVRKKKFRIILEQLVNGEIHTLESGYNKVAINIPESTSKYEGNRRVFSRDWAERHVRTQLSRFYNQAILIFLIKAGEKKCFVPHSPTEDISSICTIYMAGKEHEIKPIYNKLIEIYENEKWDDNPRVIPQHPNCTHVICPVK